MIPIMLFLFLVGCNIENQVENSQQRQLESQRKEYWQAYQSAANQIKQSEIFNQSREASCDFIRANGRQFYGWSGVLQELTTTQGGGMVMRVVLRSERYGLPVDYVHSFIEQEDALYHKLSELKQGQRVYFNFAFNEEVEFFNISECLDELSLTEEGSLMNPEFSITLHDVAGKKRELSKTKITN